MIKVIILGVLLLSTVGAISTYTYTFNATATSTQVKPAYPLGTLNTTETLSVTLQLPSPNGHSLSQFLVHVKDSSNQNFIQVLSFTGTTNSATWVVNANSSYFLEVTTGTVVDDAVIFYLSATAGSRSLLRVTDVLRKNVYKYFYIGGSETGTLNLAASPSTANPVLRLITMTPGNQLLAVGAGSTLSPATTNNGANQYTVVGLAPGRYYALQVTSDVVVSVAVTFQTSQFPCPYNSAFADFHSIFTGCTADPATSNSGLPCISYDYVNLKCLSCLTGYNLVNGRCELPPQCGPRQFFTFGQCYPVSETCGNFDAFTGACTTCANSTLILENGACRVNTSTINCTNGTRLVGSICVANNCSSGLANGTCTGCINGAFVLTGGVCVAINCGSGFYFNITLNNCAPLPTQCTAFDPLLQRCSACAASFFFNGSACLQPTNSVNCQTYNFTTNKCDVCNSGFVFNITLCVPIVVAPTCPTGQFRVNFTCYNLPSNCLSLTNVLTCGQCATNYRIVAGICAPCNGINANFPCVTCPFNQYINATTGRCVAASSQCLTINSVNGLCTRCVSGAEPVEGICCASGSHVVQGKCVEINPPLPPGQSPEIPRGQVPQNPRVDFGGYYKYCKIYTPTLALCTECLSGHYFDYADHCL